MRRNAAGRRRGVGGGGLAGPRAGTRRALSAVLGKLVREGRGERDSAGGYSAQGLQGTANGNHPRRRHRSGVRLSTRYCVKRSARGRKLGAPASGLPCSFRHPLFQSPARAWRESEPDGAGPLAEVEYAAPSAPSSPAPRLSARTPVALRGRRSLGAARIAREHHLRAVRHRQHGPGRGFQMADDGR